MRRVSASGVRRVGDREAATRQAVHARTFVFLRRRAARGWLAVKLPQAAGEI